jgi:uncharacterized protein YdhG (YjbR/CyaY superfamily)
VGGPSSTEVGPRLIRVDLIFRSWHADPMGEETREVDAYIAKCPRNAQARLKEVRKAILEAVPDAVGAIRQFNIPSYSLPGGDYTGVYGGVFVWFGLQSKHIGLYLRPPAIGDHKKDLAGFVTTKSAVHLPLDKEVPAALVKKLVNASKKITQEASRINSVS